ncbi:HAD-like domain-containing protein [Apiospora rasikravindrae]|uniref:HAD-like domain-containing protein n=1 Tax=Apiospora rasikravindrae TaxID=990691 RepID=A0ABR1U0G6_9PEZI
MAPRTDFPPVRACLFDMDGLLLDTEDLYTLCINIVLEKYGRPSLPWSIKAKLQGRPFPQSSAIFSEWAKLPVSDAEYQAEVAALQQQHFPTTQPLPGVVKLLADLGRTRYWDTSAAAASKDNAGQDKKRVHIALATSSHANNFRIKTTHLTDLFSVFPSERRVLGDDKRVGPGRGKPLPDIYHLALSTINASLAPGEEPIKPEECLVFEDSVPGVESGRRAGMRVVWVPHPMLKKEYAGREPEVLAGRMNEAADEGNRHGGSADAEVGELNDGWAEYLETLVDFPYEKYGMAIPPPEVELEPEMQQAAKEPVAADETVKS